MYGIVEVTAVLPLKLTIHELTLFPGTQSRTTELGVTFENDRFVGVGHVGASRTSKLSIAISPDQFQNLFSRDFKLNNIRSCRNGNTCLKPLITLIST